MSNSIYKYFVGLSHWGITKARHFTQEASKKIEITYQIDSERRDNFHSPKRIKRYTNLAELLAKQTTSSFKKELTLPHFRYKEYSFYEPIAYDENTALKYYEEHLAFHKKYTLPLFKKDKIPVFLTTYHEDGLPFYQAIKEKHGEDVTLVVFDTHFDAIKPHFTSASFNNWGIHQGIINPQKLVLVNGHSKPFELFWECLTTLSHIYLKLPPEIDPLNEIPLPEIRKPDNLIIRNVATRSGRQPARDIGVEIVKKTLDFMAQEGAAYFKKIDNSLWSEEAIRALLNQPGDEGNAFQILWLLGKGAKINHRVIEKEIEGDVVISFDGDFADSLLRKGNAKELHQCLQANAKALKNAKVRGIQFCELDSSSFLTPHPLYLADFVRNII